jgi:NAD+ synthase (glutamine-hydrolysing)
MRLALAQVNPTVGDLAGNARKILEYLQLAHERGADLVLFPELVLTGYPPEDLLLKPAFLRDAAETLEEIRHQAPPVVALVGYPRRDGASIRNSLAIFRGETELDTYDKGTLPNYGVFDEKRYFRPSVRCPVYHWGAWRLAPAICEDLWVPGGLPGFQVREGGAQLLLVASASPYHAGKGRYREDLARHRARQYGAFVAHVNLVGAQDELVFDGHSVLAAPDGSLLARARSFEEDLLVVELPQTPPEARADARGLPGFQEPFHEDLEFQEEHLYLDVRRWADPPAAGSPREAAEVGLLAPELEPLEEVYRALVLGLKDYVHKNGFQCVVVGLSGGIDSALTATIAADALGPENVLGLSMPSPYTSRESLRDARELAQRLGIRLDEIPIGEIFDAFREALAEPFRGRPEDVTEENLQARIRGSLLMAYSNKLGALVLATGNKSEMAVGYCTLYGDMVGGFAILKDVFKTRVYELARWRNARGPAPGPIPQHTLTRPPSAELRPDQRDEDTLPPYPVLDPILERIIEEDRSLEEIVAEGFDPRVVEQVYRWVDGNEYKRRQAPPGVKLTPRAFGKDRRYPITNRYRPRWRDPAGSGG